MSDFSFENLDVYKKAINFVDNIYILTKDFPKDELFGIISQFRRAAVSISLNVAEGSAGTKKEFRRYIDIAKGSVYECVAILEMSLNQKYIPLDIYSKNKKQLTELSKMLNGLKNSLQ